MCDMHAMYQKQAPQYQTPPYITAGEDSLSPGHECHS